MNAFKKLSKLYKSLQHSAKLIVTFVAPTFLVRGLYRRLPEKEGSSGARAPDPLRMLIVRSDGIGDFVLSTPFLREIRRSFPAAEITLLVGANVMDLALPCPYVNTVLKLPTFPPSFSSLPSFIGFANENLSGKFDMAILPRWDVDRKWATLAAYLSRAPRIIAFTRKTSRTKALMNFGSDLLLTDIVPPGSQEHEADRSLDLVRYLGGVVQDRTAELWWSRDDEAKAQEFLTAHVSSGQPGSLFAFGIGAAAERRRWPFYPDLLGLLKDSFTFTPLIFIAEDERQFASIITTKFPDAVIVCQALPVAAALLSRCSLFIGNDSGPMHIASAVGIPVIQISCHPKGGDSQHENSPLRFGPATTKRAIVQPALFLGDCQAGCKENYAHCVSTIGPDRILSEVQSLLPATVN